MKETFHSVTISPSVILTKGDILKLMSANYKQELESIIDDLQGCGEDRNERERFIRFSFAYNHLVKMDFDSPRLRDAIKALTEDDTAAAIRALKAELGIVGKRRSG